LIIMPMKEMFMNLLSGKTTRLLILLCITTLALIITMSQSIFMALFVVIPILFYVSQSPKMPPVLSAITGLFVFVLPIMAYFYVEVSQFDPFSSLVYAFYVFPTQIVTIIIMRLIGLAFRSSE
jgi:hypothetical protein